MDGSAAKADLAYVADGNGEVVVFNFSNDSLAGYALPLDPKGDCVDKKGDVFVADFGALKVDEYAHGGKKPIAVIDTSPYQPYACSVDLKKRKPGMANYGTTTKGAGNIACTRTRRASRSIHRQQHRELRGMRIRRARGSSC